MFDKKTHRVKDRIVSISQPYIRPIVRGKVKTPVEFGIKFDLSLDEYGMGRIEEITFDPYNESEVLQGAVESYRARNGHYPERVLADLSESCKQAVLQGTWDPVIGSQAWSAKGEAYGCRKTS